MAETNQWYDTIYSASITLQTSVIFVIHKLLPLDYQHSALSLSLTSFPFWWINFNIFAFYLTNEIYSCPRERQKNKNKTKQKKTQISHSNLVWPQLEATGTVITGVCTGSSQNVGSPAKCLLHYTSHDKVTFSYSNPSDINSNNNNGYFQTPIIKSSKRLTR